MSEQSNPSIVDQAADLLVFGPIGLLVDRSVVLPDLAARGRTAVCNQVTLARFLGEFAVRKGERWVSGWVERQRAALAVERAGTGPQPGAPAQPDGPATGPASEPAEQHIPVTQVVAEVPAVDELALSDYDSLAATQVIAQLDGLTPSQRQEIARYEAAHRGRRTILGKIAQLA